MEEQDTPSPKTGYKKFTTKELVFFLASGALLVPAGYFWKNLITGGVSTQPVDYVLPIAATIGFSIVFVLTSVLAAARWLSWIIFPLVVSGAIAFIPLWAGNYIIALITTIIGSLSLIYALYETHASYENSVTFHTSHVIKSGLSGVFTAIAFLISFYYLHVQLSKPVNIIPAELIESVVSLTTGLLGQQRPTETQTPDFSLEDLHPELSKLIPSNLLELFGAPKSTSPAKSQGDKQQQHAKNFNQQITQAIQDQINRIIEPYKPFVPYILTVLFFLSVRSLMSILIWFIAPLTSIVLNFLIAVGIAHKQKVQIEAERVFL